MSSFLRDAFLPAHDSARLESNILECLLKTVAAKKRPKDGETRMKTLRQRQANLELENGGDRRAGRGRDLRKSGIEHVRASNFNVDKIIWGIVWHKTFRLFLNEQEN